jgi:hypothetical protein
MRAGTASVRRYNDRNFPHLKFVVHYPESGKRRRAFFTSETEAASWAATKNAELKLHGTEHGEFSAALRIMAQTTLRRPRRAFFFTVELRV